MSRKLKLAAKEKDQTKLDRYTEGTRNTLLTVNESTKSANSNECTLVTSIKVAGPSPSMNETVASTKRKRSQESTPPKTDQIKKVNMSASPQEPLRMNNTSETSVIEDETSLSPELAILERILSRKQAASLEGIKNDIKKLLENEEIIRRQQDTITELKKENHELTIKYSQLEQKHHNLQTRVVNIENELCSSNLIFNGIPEGEYEEGPE